jgi:hypothetical protein
MQKAFLWLFLLLLAVGPCCCVGQQQQQGSSKQGPEANIDVLKSTVTITGTQTIGKPSAAGASSDTTVIDCSGLQGKPAYVIRCVAGIQTHG